MPQAIKIRFFIKSNAAIRDSCSIRAKGMHPESASCNTIYNK
ncbi:hypothetical protein P262_05586 [Cronobacter malonaticus]|uniref:Uncharacterized protein n=1 Tax=Cronobacter malonaticus TaxID=413503 RepID=V5U5R0_9ENTR|nr:hypothetical protein P262_05586 [Cronobacter malonaticus]